MQRTAEGICARGAAGSSPQLPPCLCPPQPCQPPLRTGPAHGCGATLPLWGCVTSPRSSIGPKIPKDLCLGRCFPPSPRDEQCPRTAAGLGLSFQAGSAPPAAAHRSSARLSCEGFTPRLGWGLHQHWHQDWGSGARPGAGSGAGTCSRSLSLPTTAALPQSMASEKGSSQPSLSSTGMQAACGGTPQAGTEPPAPGEGVSGAPARPVPAEPRGSGRSPSACPGARCRRWSCAAAPGSQTWNGRWGGGQAWPPPLL